MTRRKGGGPAETSDADFAAAARKLAGVERNLQALPVFSTWRDQRDNFARLLREAKDTPFEHAHTCAVYGCTCGVAALLERIDRALEAARG